MPNSLDPDHRHFAGPDLGPNNLKFILGFENLGEFLKNSEHFTEILVFSLLCLYKYIPLLLKIRGIF